ncbi:hypothetical protein KP509_33G049500 [Ceratopteris richardii]|uniref:AB hydrolase-1 domain-containing protein n=1 Tax=Ceratopteris richardii TaxID=49495 RepID=A0A8T2QPV9_CERRI|nr:hypothetical protein KP509_33G049500 [Ceratopteris richardii]
MGNSVILLIFIVCIGSSTNIKEYRYEPYGGDVWVLNTPSEALGFIMADAGYDVWIGNTRTTRYSMGHSTLRHTDSAYWDWSLDEMAEQDLPAMLDLVYSITHERIHYIGYSQGSQQALAAFSQGRALTYINKVVMLAPVAFVDHGSAPLELGLFDLHVDQILQAAHVNEFSTKTSMGTQVVDLICGQTNRRCYQSWIFLFAGDNCCLNFSKRELLEKYETQVTSVKNLAHLAQQGRRSNFAHFDYGSAENLRRYGRPVPPPYSLSEIPPLNMLFISGLRDALADQIDVTRLIMSLRSNVHSYVDPSFGHLDFILADSANSRVYDQVINFLET